MKRLLASMVLVLLSWSYINVAMAQTLPSPVPVASAAPAAVKSVQPGVEAGKNAVVAVAGSNAQSGVMGWIESHGGFQAAVLLLVFSMMTLLSALRKVLYSYDGVNEGDPIPPEYKGLTTVNKICVVGGTVLDFIQGNIKH
jgi:hypothetical protein